MFWKDLYRLPNHFPKAKSFLTPFSTMTPSQPPVSIGSRKTLSAIFPCQAIIASARRRYVSFGVARSPGVENGAMWSMGCVRSPTGVGGAQQVDQDGVEPLAARVRPGTCLRRGAKRWPQGPEASLQRSETVRPTIDEIAVARPNPKRVARGRHWSEGSRAVARNPVAASPGRVAEVHASTANSDTSTRPDAQTRNCLLPPARADLLTIDRDQGLGRAEHAGEQ